MIDALMLAMGGRADASVIRPGETKCTVSALFNFDKDNEPYQWLQTLDLATEGQEVWLKRVIYAEGRSKAYINGEPMPLQKLKSLSELLLDIHGQHQHQRLLDPATHRTQLDHFADHDTRLARIHTLYEQHRALQDQKTALESKAKDEVQAEFLRFQIDELQDTALTEDALQALNEEHQCLHHAKSYLESLNALRSQLKEAEHGPDILTQLHQVLQELGNLPQENAHLSTARELIQNALIQCEEASHEVESFADKVQLDPVRLTDIEKQLSELHALARKYHTGPEQLHEKLQELIQEEASLDKIESERARIQAELGAVEKAYNKEAIKLRASRMKHALTLEKEITKALQGLDIPNGVIRLNFTPLDTMHPHGLDRVEYDVSTNPGIPPHPLTKVASGGELSRISLAIQVITAKRAQTPTLFFDEVDVGIGGKTAARVGKLLRNLGERLQVFCVTHQPQVAAAAHHHMQVKKHVENTHTFSEVCILNQDERRAEIARMLGGLQITEETHKHARSLLTEHG